MGLSSFFGLDSEEKKGTPIHPNTLRAFKAHRSFLNNMVLKFMEKSSVIDTYMRILDQTIKEMKRGYSLETLAPKAPIIKGVMEFAPYESDVVFFKNVISRPNAYLDSSNIDEFFRIKDIVNKLG